MASTYSIGDKVTITDLKEDWTFEGVINAIDDSGNETINYASVQALGLTLKIDNNGKVIKNENN